MQPQQTDNLKGLIQKSAILSPGERAEWLTLLDLMNDKQQMELEKILNTGIKNQELRIKEQAKAPVPVTTLEKHSESTSQAKPVAPAVPVKPPEPLKQMPKLSHIMNLPNLQRSAFSLQGSGKAKAGALHPLAGGSSINLLKNTKANNFSPAISSKTIKSEADVKKNGFLSRLKQALTEKELTAGKQESQLELTGVKAQTPVPTASFKPEEKKPISIPLVPPKPYIPAATVKVEPIAFPIRPIQTISSQASGQELVSKLDINNKVASGLNTRNASDQLRKDTLESIKQHIQKEGQPGSINSTPQAELNIKELNDLALLKPSNLDNSNLLSAVKKIKALITKSGYHDVVFTLEKSDAYKLYIKTGLELLTKQMDFETLAGQDTGNKFMSREQFEKITDLLRQIQAA